MKIGNDCPRCPQGVLFPDTLGGRSCVNCDYQVYDISLDTYEISNLKSVLAATGHSQSDSEFVKIGRNPIQVINTGDWMGQLYQKLPDVDYVPNIEPHELAERARKWK